MLLSATHSLGEWASGCGQGLGLVVEQIPHPVGEAGRHTVVPKIQQIVVVQDAGRAFLHAVDAQVSWCRPPKWVLPTALV